MSRNVVSVSMGAMGVLAGISVMIASNDFKIRLAGGVLAFIGLAMCMLSYKLARDDDYIEIEKQKAEMRSSERMLSELENMNKNISGLIKEIRQDRKAKERRKRVKRGS